MKARIQSVLVLAAVLVGIVGIVSWASSTTLPTEPIPIAAENSRIAEITPTISKLNAWFSERWQAAQVTPAELAPDLQILRRMSLALCGTVPSLEEIRQFEADSGPQRLLRWADRLLDDPRYFDYFSDRLSRSFVGADEGQFIVFRRGRFNDWLGEQLRANRPYDATVREMISQTGLWTGNPATNFITAAVNGGNIDENKLAGRSVRAFLGQRIDCAQCHDHPFDHWKQSEFEGLASWFGQAKLSIVGVEDKPNLAFEVEDRNTLKKRTVIPGVPFHPEWLPSDGTRREQLAVWITHPQNRRFERATANRVWGLLFGKPYVSPVDSIPDPPESGEPDLLDFLGTDFREHGYDLRRLILAILGSRPFQLDSSHPATDAETVERLEETWGVFPLTRLRPEQIIGSMLQAASLKTIDQNSHLIVRTIRFFRERDFVNEYGDLGENELEEHPGTIPQALLRMNGNFTNDSLKSGFLNSSGRIANFAGSDETCLETCFLVCLSRRPTSEEKQQILPQLQAAKKKQRPQVVEDVYWSLFNSPEFSWNH